jgi:hypothetical protein
MHYFITIIIDITFCGSLAHFNYFLLYQREPKISYVFTTIVCACKYNVKQTAIRLPMLATESNQPLSFCYVNTQHHVIWEETTLQYGVVMLQSQFPEK